jgi:predicted O-methyltransferase YrrM
MNPKLDIYQVKSEVESKLRQGYITSRVLLGRARFIEEGSTKTSSFNDPAHLPFFYHFATLIKPKTVVESGVGLGLRAACLAQGTEITRFLGLQEVPNSKYYSPRLAKGNVGDHCKGKINIHSGLITDSSFIDSLNAIEWDLALISEKLPYERQMLHMDLLWSRVKLGGMMLIDNQESHEASQRAFKEFCKIKNRDPVVINTRYGVGVIQN